MPDFRIFNPPGLFQPKGYSQVAEVSSGKVVYIAGQVATDASGKLVGAGDFLPQVEQVFKNLKIALESVGADFTKVVKMNAYFSGSVDPAELILFREIRDKYVSLASPPVSTLMIVHRLARAEYMVEVEAVCVI
jgi:enamine deaminase RidA (YjgF/YER057c/UK114 family)